MIKTPIRHPFPLSLLTLVLLLATSKPLAQEKLTVEPTFEQCRSSLRQKAADEGFSDFILNDVIGNLTPLERVIKLDRTQPEFTESFAGYVRKRVSKLRIDTGKRMLQEHAVLLERLERQYGIPPRYIVAFWGLETNFGSYKGKIEILNALATLACDARRSEYFTQELFGVFSLLESQQVKREQLLGSWAGAMGHMQFMPSALKTYGKDGDGDGKLNVWDSLPDAFTSAANYLQQIGWNKEEIWGRRVEIPKKFAFGEVTFDKPYPLSHFKALGITKTFKRPLPDYETQAQLVLPAGHTGPAFLAYENFSVILKWNFSQNYALAVGLLADQFININNGLDNIGEEHNFFTNEDLKLLQQKLIEKGFDIGEPDGIWGPMMRNALQKYQLQNKLVADGFPNREVFATLAIELGKR